LAPEDITRLTAVSFFPKRSMIDTELCGGEFEFTQAFSLRQIEAFSSIVFAFPSILIILRLVNLRRDINSIGGHYGRKPRKSSSSRQDWNCRMVFFFSSLCSFAAYRTY
jgi:hypothetical protein